MSGPYQIQKFDLTSIKPGSFIVSVGKRGSGKSFLTRDFFYQNKKKIKNVVVFSSTEGENKFYSDFIPSTFIYTDLNIDKLQAIYDGQKEFIMSRRKACKERGVEYKEATWDDNLLVVIDDFMHKKNIFNTETMKNIVFNGRHANLSFVILVQYCMVLPTEYRTQVDVCFLYKEVINANKKRLFEYYAGFFSNLREFNRIFDELTRNYGCMVIKMTNTDARCAEGGVENMCFFYKAGKTPKFKVAKELWKYQTKMKNEHKRKAVEFEVSNKTVRLL